LLAPVEEAKGDGEDDSGGMMAWSTGIAEIALPIEFKMRNIEETDQLRRQMEGERRVRHRTNEFGLPMTTSGGGTAFQRLLNPTQNRPGPHSSQTNVDSMKQKSTDILAAPAASASSEAGGGPSKHAFVPRTDGKPRYRQSSDDRAMDMYKKRQNMNRR
jgi:hypothetical protein